MITLMNMLHMMMLIVIVMLILVLMLMLMLMARNRVRWWVLMRLPLYEGLSWHPPNLKRNANDLHVPGRRVTSYLGQHLPAGSENEMLCAGVLCGIQRTYLPHGQIQRTPL
jgi:hypothetical protein